MCRFDAMPSAPECSLPTCLVQPLLPGDESADVCSAAAAGPAFAPRALHAVGWFERQVSIEELARLDALGLQRRLAAREGGQDTSWRGFSVSVPFMPGGGTHSMVHTNVQAC